MITVKDIAKQAGVSPGTVSNVLTGKRPVATATQERVRQAIAELGYQPNMLARSLINQRTHMLGVVAYGRGLQYYGAGAILAGIEQRASELGYSLTLSLLHDVLNGDAEATLRGLVTHRVDGILWAVPEIGDGGAWIQSGSLSHLPPILFLSTRPRPDISVVDVDNYTGGMQATQHLIDSGRRVIGVIGVIGVIDDWWSANQRMDGWRTCLRQAGLPCDDSLVAWGDWSAASGERSLRQLLEQRPDIDAIFACNDQMALGALRAAHLSGRRVPLDLAIVGYDDTPESGYFWPPLTTIHQDLSEMGRVGMNELHKLIEAKDNGAAGEPVTHLVKPRLLVRESSCAGSEC